MNEFDPIFRVFVFLFGSIVGSFLNVCIYRLPREESVVLPRSRCTHCKKQISWHDNIPFVSYILLLGKCRSCKKRISPRYFIVELTTAVTFLYFYNYYGLSIVLLPYFVFVAGLIVATFVDLEHRIIPDEVSIGGMVAGLIFSCFIPQLHVISLDQYVFSDYLLSAGRSVLGVLIGGGSIYAMGMLGDFIFKKETMGGGDVKLLAMVGAFLGWKLALLAFFIAPFFGAVFGVIVKIKTKESVIAYGPFLVLGSLISLFWGERIIEWIMRGYGVY